jgi:hypothetical protein
MPKIIEDWYSPMPQDTWGLRSNNYEEKTCCQCHQVYKHYNTEIVYKSDFNKATFCSYNCRSAYYKEHKKQRKAYHLKKEMQYMRQHERQLLYDKQRYGKKKSQN